MKSYYLKKLGIQVEVVGKSGVITSKLKDDLKQDEPLYAALDGMEALILACACNGVLIDRPAFVDAIQTAMDAIGNSYGD